MVSASLAKCSKISIISNRTHQHFGNTGKAILHSYADTARKTGSPFSYTGWSTVSRKTTKPFYQRTQRVCLGPAHISNVFLQTMGHLCIFCLGDNKQDLRKVQRKDRSESWGQHNARGALFPAMPMLRGCSCLPSSKRILPNCNQHGCMGQILGKEGSFRSEEA